MMDSQGNALAHSNPARVGMNFDEAGLRSCLATGKTIEQIYIRDADKPLSPYHGQKTIDILSPYYSSAGKIEGAVNVGISLAAVERAKMHYITVSAVGTILWLFFISFFAVFHVRTIRQITGDLEAGACRKNDDVSLRSHPFRGNAYVEH